MATKTTLYTLELLEYRAMSGTTEHVRSVQLNLQSRLVEFACHTKGPRGGFQPGGHFALSPADVLKINTRCERALDLLNADGVPTAQAYVDAFQRVKVAVFHDVWGETGDPGSLEFVEVMLDHLETHGGLSKAWLELFQMLPRQKRHALALEAR
jgi:hypothetical protein